MTTFLNAMRSAVLRVTGLILLAFSAAIVLTVVVMVWKDPSVFSGYTAVLLIVFVGFLLLLAILGFVVRSVDTRADEKWPPSISVR